MWSGDAFIIFPLPLPSCTPRVLFALFSNGILLWNIRSTQLSVGSCSCSCITKLLKVAISAFKSWGFQCQGRPVLRRLSLWRKRNWAAFAWHWWSIHTQRFVHQSPPVHCHLPFRVILFEKKLINLSLFEDGGVASMSSLCISTSGTLPFPSWWREEASGWKHSWPGGT